MSVITKAIFYNMLRRNCRKTNEVSSRPIKNFGHKREPVPLVTTLWHGFLTLTFISFILDWERIKTFMFGDSLEIEVEESISNDKN